MPNLWNVQTQKPEWVRPEAVQSALASGSFVEYEGSDVVTSPAEGLLAARPAATAATELSPIVSAGAVRAEQLEAEERAAQDNLAAEALTLMEGGIAGLSAGLLDPADLSRDAMIRREVNPVAGGLGMAGGALGGAALGVGPAGWVSRGAGRVAASVAARASTPAARLVVQETVAGALEGAGFSAGAQVGGALWADRPFSAEAVATDAGLGAFLGGALAGGKLAAARTVRRAEESRSALNAADDLLNKDSPLSKGVADDFRGIGRQWDDAMSGAAARVEALSAAAARGEVPGIIRGPLHVREKLVREARAAQEQLRRAMRVGKDTDPWQRLDEVLDSGTPKRVASVARALDNYGAAVQKLDNAMRPQGAEVALSPRPVQLGERTVLDPPGAGGPATSPGVLAPRAPAPTRLGDPNVAPPGGPGSGYVTETFVPPPRTVVDGTPVPESFTPGTAPTGPMAAPGPGFRRSPAMANVVPGQAVRDFVAAAPGVPTPPTPSALADALSARLGKLDAVLIPRGASLDFAEAAGARVEGLGPLGERAMQLWALRRFAKKLGAVRPERTTSGRLLEEGAALAAGIAMPGGLGAKWAARQVARAAIRGAVGIGESIGRVKLGLAKGVDAALGSPGTRAALRRAPLAIDYTGEDRPTRDFNQKAAALRSIAGSPEALRARLASSPATADLRGMDPDLAALATEAAATRLEALAAALPPLPPSEGFPGVEPGTSPVNSAARSEWENRERVAADPAATTLAAVRAGAVPPEIIETIRETNPLLLNRLADQVLNAGPEVLAAAPHATLIGLSKVLGIPLVPEADPMYRARAQERFKARREANQEIQQRQAGASAIRGGMMIAPTPGQVMASPPPPVNLR